MSNGYCARCHEHTAYLMPLHGERGGAMCCITCVGSWHAEHGRKRNRGRVAIRAMISFLDAGGTTADLGKLQVTAIGKDFFSLDPLGYLHGIADARDDTVELTSELLNDALALTHPDKHPPERHDLAQRVTSQLLAIKPFVFPAIKKKPVKVDLPKRSNTSLAGTIKPAKDVLQYPCPTCASTHHPVFYCGPCLAEWKKRERKKREQDNASRRAAYARRKRPRDPATCRSCGKKFVSKRRKDARFCSLACRVRAHRKENCTKWYS